jgi:hypothetical protein
LRISKIATASVLSLSVGTLGFATAASAGTTHARSHVHSVPSTVVPDGTVTISPSTQLVNGEVVQVTINFPTDPDGTVLNVGECSSHILTHQSVHECDNTDADSAHPTLNNHTATTPFTIRTGSSFHGDLAKRKCDPKPAHACYLVATDSKDPNSVVDSGFATLDFGKNTKTKLSGKKSIKAGSALKLKVVTSNTFHPSGKVVIKDGSKKVATLKEKASGTVKTTLKKLKKGKHKLSATYSGDSNNKTSKGKLTVTVH